MLTNDNDNDNTSLLMTCYQQYNKTQIGATISPHLLQASLVDTMIDNWQGRTTQHIPIGRSQH